MNLINDNNTDFFFAKIQVIPLTLNHGRKEEGFDDFGQLLVLGTDVSMTSQSIFQSIKICESLRPVA